MADNAPSTASGSLPALLRAGCPAPHSGRSRQTRKVAGRQGVKRANTLKLLPSRLASRAYGAVNRMPLPVPLRAVAYSSWAWAFKAKLHEAGLPLASYPSLNAFFTRKLKAGLRPVDADAALVSPVDGIVVSSSSDLKRDGILKQVKAIDFRPEDFLGLPAPPDVRIPGNVLHSAVIYLSPGHYHRFHSPTEWSVTSRTHIAGQCLPVNPLFAHLLPSLFCTNERVVLSGEWAPPGCAGQRGLFTYTAVAATNVGSIRLTREPTLYTNLTRDDWRCGFSVAAALGGRVAALPLRVPSLPFIAGQLQAALPSAVSAVQRLGSAGQAGVSRLGRGLASTLAGLNPLTFLAPQRSMHRTFANAQAHAQASASASAISGVATAPASAGSPASAAAAAAAASSSAGGGEGDTPAPVKARVRPVRKGWFSLGVPARGRAASDADDASGGSASSGAAAFPLGAAPSTAGGAAAAKPGGVSGTSITAAATGSSGPGSGGSGSSGVSGGVCGSRAAPVPAGVHLPSAPILRHHTYPEPQSMRAGDEVGWFELGSTIVLIFEAPPEFRFNGAVTPRGDVIVGRPLTDARRESAGPRGEILGPSDEEMASAAAAVAAAASSVAAPGAGAGSGAAAEGATGSALDTSGSGLLDVSGDSLPLPEGWAQAVDLAAEADGEGEVDHDGDDGHDDDDDHHGEEGAAGGGGASAMPVLHGFDGLDGAPRSRTASRDWMGLNLGLGLGALLSMSPSAGARSEAAAAAAFLAAVDGASDIAEGEGEGEFTLDEGAGEDEAGEGEGEGEGVTGVDAGPTPDSRVAGDSAGDSEDGADGAADDVTDFASCASFDDADVAEMMSVLAGMAPPAAAAAHARVASASSAV